MAEDKNKCAHPSCTCQRTKDSKYCSTYCKDAKGTLELACNCGHAGCGTTAMAETPATTMTA